MVSFDEVLPMLGDEMKKREGEVVLVVVVEEKERARA